MKVDISVISETTKLMRDSDDIYASRGFSNTSANTDNMGKLFVTVFAKPCSQDKSYQNVHPDARHYTQYKSNIP
jgi:hypothetical protein